MAYRRKGMRKGSKCVRRKRVHVRGRGMAWRCAKYRVRGGRKTAPRKRKRARYSKLPKGYFNRPRALTYENKLRSQLFPIY